MGQNIKQFSQPVCRSFRRKILKDQVCYEVDVNQEMDGAETANIGLGFLYDNNFERFLHSEDNVGGRKNDDLGFLSNFVTMEETQKTLIYISSLGSYVIIINYVLLIIIFRATETLWRGQLRSNLSEGSQSYFLFPLDERREEKLSE